MKKMITAIISVLTILYLMLEVQSILLAVNSLLSKPSYQNLIRFESIAYATAGLGFTLFFTVQGFHYWRTKNKKRYIIAPIILAPVIFLLGQTISVSIVENIPDTLSNKQKGLALKSTMLLQEGKSKGIAPFFLERQFVLDYPSADIASKYYSLMSEKEAKLQIIAGVDFITEINLAYKHSQPSEKELRIYRSKLLSDFLMDGKYRLFDFRGINAFMKFNPVEINPFVDLSTDINALLTQNDLNISQKVALVRYHLERKNEQYNDLLARHTLTNNKANVRTLFEQNDEMDYLERVYMLSKGFGVSKTVSELVAEHDAQYALYYGMTYKMFESIIPFNHQTKPLSLGLSETQFLNHQFVDDMIKINAPIMKFEEVEFIPISKLADHNYAKSINKNIREGLSENAFTKVKQMNTVFSIDMFNGGFRWDGIWAKNAMMKKLVPSVSMPVIIAVSMTLILLNLVGTISLLGASGKIQAGVVLVFIILIYFIDLKITSEIYFDNVYPHLEWLLNGLSNIGMKPSEVY